jgi:molybdopterin-biosynthesis enzyme MoeA-like protein
LFELGIELKRIEVVPDDENAIGIAIRQHSAAHDFVFTSGGIGIGQRKETRIGD